jgi:oligoribonuclease
MVSEKRLIMPDRLIWLDLEMTGLAPDRDRIIEMATVITDFNLEVIAIGPELVIKQADDILDGMNEWCVIQHGNSGLTSKVRASTTSESEAEELTLEFLRQYVNEKSSPMCGNTICQDRRFLYRYMPKLEAFFHYRNLDVSSVKILAQMWAPNLPGSLKKNLNHRAKDDVLESIAELKLYREQFIGA